MVSPAARLHGLLLPSKGVPGAGRPGIAGGGLAFAGGGGGLAFAALGVGLVRFYT